MKKLFLLFTLTFAAGVAMAQNDQDDGKVEMIECTGFEIIYPFQSADGQVLAPQPLKIKDKRESMDRYHRIPYLWEENPEMENTDDIYFRQTEPGSKQMSPPLVSWNGQQGSGYPPDPTGVAGPNHFVQAVNMAYRVYTKTGGAVSGGGPYTLGSLFYGNSNDAGDPIVLYDKFADRWFISEFSTAGKLYIAVSQTSSPTGAYYKWQFSSPQFPDYPKYSIWHDGYYMTSNQSTQKVFCFERSQMLAGATSPRGFYKTFSPPRPGSFFCPLAADADGQLPPAGTPCPIFSYEDNAWGSGYADRINIFNMTVNWGTTPSATITGPTQLASAAFDASYNTYWNDIPQPGTTQKLDGIGGVFTFRAQYRRWTGYNTVVLCMGVKVSSSQRSIRWYELRQNTGTSTWSIYQQSTYAPTDGLYRWCGSIAMDNNGSIGMAYAVSGSSGTSPGIRYTGRAASDPLNQMPYTEQTAATGSGYQTGTNRFGDYSHTSLDPSDGTILWHTGEYLVSGNIATKIFSFRIPSTSGMEDVDSPQAGVLAYQTNGKLMVKAENLPSNNPMVVDLFDILGNRIGGQTVHPVAGSIETSFATSGLAAGTYLVRIGEANTSFQKVVKVVVN